MINIKHHNNENDCGHVNNILLYYFKLYLYKRASSYIYMTGTVYVVV